MSRCIILTFSYVVVPQERKSSLPDVLEDSSEGENDVSVVYGTIYVKNPGAC